MARWTHADATRVRDAAVALVERHRLPGMGLGVVKARELVFAEGFGHANIETRRHQDPGLRQRIGSITKTMVGLATMALVDEKRLDLEDRVADLLPDLRFNGPAEGLTLWHLLTHTSGIGEAPTMAGFLRPLELLFVDEPETRPLAQRYPDGIDIEQVPGTHWHYQNHGFALLGEIVARTEGCTVAEALDRRVFQPLGMTQTDALDRPHADLTTGYHRVPGHDELDVMELLGADASEEQPVDGTNIPGKYIYIGTPGAGEVQSTILDMALYATALMDRGAGIVRPETFQRMAAHQYGEDERLMGWGLSFQRRRRFGRPALEHGGGVGGGWNTLMSILPEDSLAVLVHINQSVPMAEEVYSRVLQAVLDAPSPAYPVASLDTDLARAATGVYVLPPGKLTNHRPNRAHGRLQLQVEDGNLVLRSRRGTWRDGVRLLSPDPEDPGFFVLDTGAPEPPGLALVQDGSGAVTGLRLDRLVTMSRSATLEPWYPRQATQDQRRFGRK